MWDKILDSIYISLKQENNLRAEQGLKALTFKQYVKMIKW